MVGLLVVYSATLVILFGFFIWVLCDIRRGLREMRQLTRKVEALLDQDTRQAGNPPTVIG